MTLSERGIGYLKRHRVFLQGVVLLSGGSAFSQILPVLISPILTRLYAAEAFGIYALYLSVFNLLGQVICLKYDMAISIVSKEQEARKLCFLCQGLSFLAGLICLMAVPFAKELTPILGSPSAVWLLPFSILMLGSSQTMLGWSIRKEDYVGIAGYFILKSLSAAFLQLLFSISTLGATALILGQTASYLIGNIWLVLRSRELFFGKRPRLSHIVALAKQYSSYPRCTMPGAAAGNLVYYVSNLSISLLFSSEMLGYYSLINRLLAAPISLVSGAVGQAFMPRLAKETGQRRLLFFFFVSGGLSLMAIPIFLICWAALPAIPVIFGEDWGTAISMGRIILPLFAVRFVVVPISTSAIVAGKQGATMIWQCGMLTLSLLLAWSTVVGKWSIYDYLAWFSLLISMGYLLFYAYCGRILSRGGKERHDKREME